MKGFLATLKGKIIAGVISVLVVAGGIVAAVVVLGTQDYRSIKVDTLTGQSIIIDEKNVETEAYKGMNLKAGNMIEVKKGGNMTLLLDADKYMFADEGTKFKIEASGNSKKSSTKTKIVLEEGSVLCRLDSKLSDQETFEVETPNSVMSVRGTIFKMTIYKDENGENYARVDVLEGAVKVDLYNENGEKTGEEGLIEAGQAATVHSNPEISEFVIGESDIDYDDFSDAMATFVVEIVDNGREICIGNDLFKHYTGYETHPEEGTVIKEATCSAEGEKEIYCSTCDAVVRVEPIPVIEHTPGEWTVETEATCVERIRCTECNEIIEEREIDFSQHNLERETVETKEVCNVHRVIQDVCQNCGATQEVRTTDTVVHTYGDWQITTNPTCEAEGVSQRVCSVCGATENQNVAATGHSYGASSVVTAATCTAEGKSQKKCNNCGNTISSSIAATGHNYESVHALDYAANDPNSRTSYYDVDYTCRTCGSSYSERHTAPYGPTNGSTTCNCGASVYWSS